METIYGKLLLQGSNEPTGTGWLPPMPDLRDYTEDQKKIKNLKCNKETTGALLIRNSWGKEWGDKGYGWLPYDYVLNKLATDFWSLLGMDWVDSKQFG